MEKFLPNIAKQILADHNGDVKNVCIICPNKRSILLAEKLLAKKKKKLVLDERKFIVYYHKF